MMADNDDSLPDNIIQLSTYRRNDNKPHCTCYHWATFPKKQLQLSVDRENREITCRHCGTVIDPFDAHLLLMKSQDDRQREIDDLYHQAQELREYKPWRRAIKDIEQHAGNGKMVPTCPHCQEAVFLEELTYGSWVSKELVLQQRKFQKNGGDDNG